MIMFEEEKEPTIEEIVDELRINEDSYSILKQLNMLEDLKQIYSKDNGVNICRADLRNAFNKGKIIGYIEGLNVNDYRIKMFENSNNAKWIIIYVQGVELNSRDIDEIVEIVNRKLDSEANCLYGFSYSNESKIKGLILESGQV